MRRLRDERGLVGRAAITLLLLIVVGGLAAVDGTAILLANLQASDVADAAASAGAANYANTHNVDAARTAAVDAATAQDDGAKVVSFSVRQGTVSVTVRKVASTLIVRHVKFLRHFGIVRATSSSGPP